MLQERNRIKTVQGNTQLTLEANSNESFRVKNIFIDSPANNYIYCTVNRVQVLYARVGGALGNHLPFRVVDEPNQSIFGQLLDLDLIRTIPVPTGMIFTVHDAHDAGSTVTIVYDAYDAGDVLPSEPNGVDSNEYDLFQYGRLSGTAAAGNNIYDTQQTSLEYPAFPFGANVPANHEFILKAVFASEVSKDDTAGTNQQKTQYLKFVHDRITLFDEDKNGHLMIGGSYTADTTNVGNGLTLLGNWSDVDERPPLILEEPLSFKEGESLDIYLNTVLTGGAANLAVTDTEIMLLFGVKRGG